MISVQDYGFHVPYTRRVKTEPAFDLFQEFIYNRINLSENERDLRLFLNYLGVGLPNDDPQCLDDYIAIRLSRKAASLFAANDEKAVLLCYRLLGTVYPLTIVFLKGYSDILFCHSSLLLDSYGHEDWMIPILQNAVMDFFSMGTSGDVRRVLGILEPSWTNAPLSGHEDHRIYWNTKPDMKIVTDLFQKKFGEVKEIPLFPTVYYYNNPYEQNILEAALPDLGDCKNALVLGTGAGLEAACIALTYGIPVDAADINPLAVANTLSACRRTGTEHLVHSWANDGFNQIKKKYDAVLFEAPLAVCEMGPNDPNRYDPGGMLLRRILKQLPSYLNKNGRMYLMSCPDLTPYMPKNGLKWETLRHFEARRPVAIHKIWVA